MLRVVNRSLLVGQRRLASSATFRFQSLSALRHPRCAFLPRFRSQRIASNNRLQTRRFSLINFKKDFQQYTEFARSKHRSFFIAVCLVAASGSFITYGWGQMKVAQLSSWTKRIYDTFVLLDTVEKYVIEPTKNDIDAVFCALEHDGGGIDRTVSVQQLRSNPFFKRCLADHQTDLAEIFEEEDQGDRVPWNVAYLTLGALYLMSREHLTTPQDIHGQMYLLIERLAEARGQDDTSSDDVNERFVSGPDVQSWLQALSYLGVIRGVNYLEAGSSLRPKQVQKKIFDELFAEGADEAGRISASLFLGDVVVAYLDYEMFVRRNTFYTAGAAMRELSRREAYLYGDIYNDCKNKELVTDVIDVDATVIEDIAVVSETSCAIEVSSVNDSRTNACSEP